MPEDRYSQPLEYLRFEDDIDNACLVFEAQKNKTLGGPGLLTADDCAGDANPAAVLQMFHSRSGDHPHPVELFPMEAHRMRANREAGVDKVRLQTLDRAHRLQRRRYLGRKRILE